MPARVQVITDVSSGDPGRAHTGALRTDGSGAGLALERRAAKGSASSPTDLLSGGMRAAGGPAAFRDRFTLAAKSALRSVGRSLVELAKCERQLKIGPEVMAELLGPTHTPLATGVGAGYAAFDNVLHTPHRTLSVKPHLKIKEASRAVSKRPAIDHVRLGKQGLCHARLLAACLIFASLGIHDDALLAYGRACEAFTGGLATFCMGIFRLLDRDGEACDTREEYRWLVPGSRAARVALRASGIFLASSGGSLGALRNLASTVAGGGDHYSCACVPTSRDTGRVGLGNLVARMRCAWGGLWNHELLCRAGAAMCTLSVLGTALSLVDSDTALWVGLLRQVLECGACQAPGQTLRALLWVAGMPATALARLLSREMRLRGLCGLAAHWSCLSGFSLDLEARIGYEGLPLVAGWARVNANACQEEFGPDQIQPGQHGSPPGAWRGCGQGEARALRGHV